MNRIDSHISKYNNYNADHGKFVGGGIVNEVIKTISGLGENALGLIDEFLSTCLDFAKMSSSKAKELLDAVSNSKDALMQRLVNILKNARYNKLDMNTIGKLSSNFTRALEYNSPAFYGGGCDCEINSIDFFQNSAFTMIKGGEEFRKNTALLLLGARHIAEMIRLRMISNASLLSEKDKVLGKLYLDGLLQLIEALDEAITHINKESVTINADYASLSKMTQDQFLEEMKKAEKQGLIKKSFVQQIRLLAPAVHNANLLKKSLEKLGIAFSDFEKVINEHDRNKFNEFIDKIIIEKSKNLDTLTTEQLRAIDTLKSLYNIGGISGAAEPEMEMDYEPEPEQEYVRPDDYFCGGGGESIFGGEIMELQNKVDALMLVSKYTMTPLETAFKDQNERMLQDLLKSAKDAAQELYKVKDITTDDAILEFLTRLEVLKVIDIDSREVTNMFIRTSNPFNVGYSRDAYLSNISNAIASGRKVQSKVGPKFSEFINVLETYKKFLNDASEKAANVSPKFLGGYQNSWAATMNDVIESFIRGVSLSKMMSGVTNAIKEIEANDLTQKTITTEVTYASIGYVTAKFENYINTYLPDEKNDCSPVDKELFTTIMRNITKAVKDFMRASQVLNDRCRFYNLKLIKNPTKAKEISELLSKVTLDINAVNDEIFENLHEFLDYFQIESVGKFMKTSDFERELARYYDQFGADAAPPGGGALPANRTLQHYKGKNNYIGATFSLYPLGLSSCVDTHCPVLIFATADGKIKHKKDLTTANEVNHYHGIHDFPAKTAVTYMHYNDNIPVDVKFIDRIDRINHYLRAKELLEKGVRQSGVLKNLFSIFQSLDKAYESETGKAPEFAMKIGQIYEAFVGYIVNTSMYPVIHDIKEANGSYTIASHIALRKFGHPITINETVETKNVVSGLNLFKALNYLSAREVEAGEYKDNRLNQFTRDADMPFPNTVDYTNTGTVVNPNSFLPYDCSLATIIDSNDNLAIMGMKSMFAKIFSVLSMFEIFNLKDFTNAAKFNDLRAIYGGVENPFSLTPEVKPENVELYVRVYFLMIFYKGLFFEERLNSMQELVTASRRMALLPSGQTVFNDLFRFIFIKLFNKKYYNSGPMDTPEIDVQDLGEFVNICNRIADHYKGSSIEIIQKIVVDIVDEVNKRYGIVSTDHIKQLFQEENKRAYPGIQKLVAVGATSSLGDKKSRDRLPPNLLDGENEAPGVANIASDNIAYTDTEVGRTFTLLPHVEKKINMTHITAVIYAFRKKLSAMTDAMQEVYTKRTNASLVNTRERYKNISNKCRIISRMMAKAIDNSTKLTILYDQFHKMKEVIHNRVDNEQVVYKEMVLSPAAILNKVYNFLTLHSNLYGRQDGNNAINLNTHFYDLFSINTDLVRVVSSDKMPKLDFSGLNKCCHSLLEQIIVYHRQFITGLQDTVATKLNRTIELLVNQHAFMWSPDGPLADKNIKYDEIVFVPINDYSEFPSVVFNNRTNVGQASWTAYSGKGVYEHNLKFEDPRANSIKRKPGVAPVTFPDLVFQLHTELFSPNNPYQLFDYLLIMFWKVTYGKTGTIYKPALDDFLDRVTSDVKIEGINSLDSSSELGGVHSFAPGMPFSDKIIIAYKTLFTSSSKSQAVIASLDMMPNDLRNVLRKYIPLFCFLLKHIIYQSHVHSKILSIGRYAGGEGVDPADLAYTRDKPLAPEGLAGPALTRYFTQVLGRGMTLLGGATDYKKLLELNEDVKSTSSARVLMQKLDKFTEEFIDINKSLSSIDINAVKGIGGALSKGSEMDRKGLGILIPVNTSLKMPVIQPKYRKTLKDIINKTGESDIRSVITNTFGSGPGELYRFDDSAYTKVGRGFKKWMKSLFDSEWAKEVADRFVLSGNALLNDQDAIVAKIGLKLKQALEPTVFQGICLGDVQAADVLAPLGHANYSRGDICTFDSGINLNEGLLKRFINNIAIFVENTSTYETLSNSNDLKFNYMLFDACMMYKKYLALGNELSFSEYLPKYIEEKVDLILCKDYASLQSVYHSLLGQVWDANAKRGIDGSDSLSVIRGEVYTTLAGHNDLVDARINMPFHESDIYNKFEYIDCNPYYDRICRHMPVSHVLNDQTTACRPNTLNSLYKKNILPYNNAGVMAGAVAAIPDRRGEFRGGADATILTTIDNLTNSINANLVRQAALNAAAVPPGVLTAAETAELGRINTNLFREFGKRDMAVRTIISEALSTAVPAIYLNNDFAFYELTSNANPDSALWQVAPTPANAAAVDGQIVRLVNNVFTSVDDKYIPATVAAGGGAVPADISIMAFNTMAAVDPHLHMAPNHDGARNHANRAFVAAPSYPRPVIDLDPDLVEDRVLNRSLIELRRAIAANRNALPNIYNSIAANPLPTAAVADARAAVAIPNMSNPTNQHYKFIVYDTTNAAYAPATAGGVSYDEVIEGQGMILEIQGYIFDNTKPMVNTVIIPKYKKFVDGDKIYVVEVSLFDSIAAYDNVTGLVNINLGLKNGLRYDYSTSYFTLVDAVMNQATVITAIRNHINRIATDAAVVSGIFVTDLSQMTRREYTDGELNAILTAHKAQITNAITAQERDLNNLLVGLDRTNNKSSREVTAIRNQLTLLRNSLIQLKTFKAQYKFLLSSIRDVKRNDNAEIRRLTGVINALQRATALQAKVGINPFIDVRRASNAARVAGAAPANLSIYNKAGNLANLDDIVKNLYNGDGTSRIFYNTNKTHDCSMGGLTRTESSVYSKEDNFLLNDNLIEIYTNAALLVQQTDVQGDLDAKHSYLKNVLKDVLINHYVNEGKNEPLFGYAHVRDAAFDGANNKFAIENTLTDINADPRMLKIGNVKNDNTIYNLLNVSHSITEHDISINVDNTVYHGSINDVDLGFISGVHSTLADYINKPSLDMKKYAIVKLLQILPTAPIANKAASYGYNFNIVSVFNVALSFDEQDFVECVHAILYFVKYLYTLTFLENLYSVDRVALPVIRCSSCVYLIEFNKVYNFLAALEVSPQISVPGATEQEIIKNLLDLNEFMDNRMSNQLRNLHNACKATVDANKNEEYTKNLIDKIKKDSNLNSLTVIQGNLTEFLDLFGDNGDTYALSAGGGVYNITNAAAVAVAVQMDHYFPTAPGPTIAYFNAMFKIRGLARNATLLKRDCLYWRQLMSTLVNNIEDVDICDQINRRLQTYAVETLAETAGGRSRAGQAYFVNVPPNNQPTTFAPAGFIDYRNALMGTLSTCRVKTGVLNPLMCNLNDMGKIVEVISINSNIHKEKREYLTKCINLRCNEHSKISVDNLSAPVCTVVGHLLEHIPQDYEATVYSLTKIYEQIIKNINVIYDMIKYSKHISSDFLSEVLAKIFTGNSYLHAAHNDYTLGAVQRGGIVYAEYRAKVVPVLESIKNKFIKIESLLYKEVKSPYAYTYSDGRKIGTKLIKDVNLTGKPHAAAAPTAENYVQVTEYDLPVFIDEQYRERHCTMKDLAIEGITQTHMLDRSRKAIYYASTLLNSFANVYSQLEDNLSYLGQDLEVPGLESMLQLEEKRTPFTYAAELVPGLVNVIDETGNQARNLNKTLDYSAMIKQQTLGIKCRNIHDLNSIFLGDRSELYQKIRIFLVPDTIHPLTLKDFPWFKKVMVMAGESINIDTSTNDSTLSSYVQQLGKLTKYLYELHFKSNFCNKFPVFNNLDVPKFNVALAPLAPVFRSTVRTYKRDVAINTLSTSIPALYISDIDYNAFSITDFLELLTGIKNVVPPPVPLVALPGDAIPLLEPEMLDYNELTSVIEIDSSDYRLDKVFQLTNLPVSRIQYMSNYDEQVNQNILDLGIFPINPYAIARDVPFFDTINNCYNHDKIISTLLNMNSEFSKTSKYTYGINGRYGNANRNPNTPLNSAARVKECVIANYCINPTRNHVFPISPGLSNFGDNLSDIYDVNSIGEANVHKQIKNKVGIYFKTNGGAAGSFNYKANIYNADISAAVNSGTRLPLSEAPVNYDNALESGKTIMKISFKIDNNRVQPFQHYKGLAITRNEPSNMNDDTYSTAQLAGFRLAHLSELDNSQSVLNVKSKVVSKLFKDKIPSIIRTGVITIPGSAAANSAANGGAVVTFDPDCYYTKQNCGVVPFSQFDLMHGIDRECQQPFLGFSIYAEVLTNIFKKKLLNDIKQNRTMTSQTRTGEDILYDDIVS